MMSHKKIHRFLVSKLPTAAIGDTITIEDKHIVHQVHTVLHLQPGEAITVFADEGQNITGEILAIDKATLQLAVTTIEQGPIAPRRVIAAISIVKGDAYELMVQKLTEIGVDTIVPIISGRTVKQQVRTARLQAISDEALEQSGGTKRVQILEPMPLEQCLKQFPFQSVVLDPLAKDMHIEHLEQTVVCYVGPEGGWDEQDEHILNAAECQHIRITDRVLRTETAAIIGIYTLLWQ